MVGTELQCRKYYEAWKLLYVGVLFSSAFESDTFPVADLKRTPDLAVILIEAAEGTDASTLTPEPNPDPGPDPTRDTPGTRSSPISENLVFVHLKPPQKRRAKRVNRPSTSITHAVSCGSYGMFFGTEERCRSEYETWRKLYVGVLFEKTFSSYSWQLSDYKTTPDLATILAKAAGSSSGRRPEPPQTRRLPPSRSGTGNQPQEVDVAAAVVKTQEHAKAKKQTKDKKQGWLGCLSLLIIGGIVWAFCSIGGSDGEDDLDLPPSNPTTTPQPGGRPSWCVHDDRVQAEIALQAELEAEHGENTADWPADDVNRWIQSINDQGTAASHLWDAAPAHYKWADVERVCREQLPPLPSAMELAEECFSAWDGNHEGFERLVKAGLNDPNSMEVHGTYFGELDRLDDGILRIRMDYSAANTIGGVTRTNAWADMRLDCSIEVVDYGYE